MDRSRRVASLSFDLDDKWAYLKTNGDAGWTSYPSFIELLVPRVLTVLHAHDLRATVFLVGQDASIDRNGPLLRAIAEKGHEIGNHSFLHDPWLHLYSPEEVSGELERADDAIYRATGQKPVGFRGPGYSLTAQTLRELVRLGYLYDSTTFPTFLMPLVRKYYFTVSNFSVEEKRRRQSLGGTWQEGWRSNKPYFWQVDGKRLLEIPITTMPGFKLPIHVSYLVALNRISRSLALRYLDAALRLCRVGGVEPSVVLHPTDFLGTEDGQGLSVIPGMDLPVATKLNFVHTVLERLTGAYSVITLREHAIHACQTVNLTVDSMESDTRRWNAFVRYSSLR